LVHRYQVLACFVLFLFLFLFLLVKCRSHRSVQDITCGQVDNAWGNAVHLVHMFLVPLSHLLELVQGMSPGRGGTSWVALSATL
jgi:hypothetical protein